MSERRKVGGRGRSFDDLLDEHKKKKRIRKLEKLKSDADVFLNQTSTLSHSSPLRYDRSGCGLVMLVSAHLRYSCSCTALSL